MSNCWKCNGSGTIYTQVEDRCPTCWGQTPNCVFCHGTGRTLVWKNITCPECHGVQTTGSTGNSETRGNVGCFLFFIAFLIVTIMITSN